MPDELHALPDYTDPKNWPMLSGILGDPKNMTLEQIKRRAAVAQAMASQKRPYPKTLGEGLTALGEGIAEGIQNRRLESAERAYTQGRAADPLFRPPGAAAPAAAPAAAAPAAVAPAATSSATAPEQTAFAQPDANSARNGIAQAIQMAQGATPEVAQQNPTLSGATEPPGGPPLRTRLASLNPVGTLTDENPVTPTDIQPMPRIAQLGGAAGAPAPTTGARPSPAPVGPSGAVPGAVGTVPGVFDRVPSQPPAPAGTAPAVDPSALRPNVKPVAPRMQETPTEEELRGMMILRKYPGDEQAQLQAQQLMTFGAARRKGDYDRRVKEYDSDMAAYNARLLAEDAHRRTKSKTDFEEQELRDRSAREAREREIFPLGKDKHIGFVTDSHAKVAAIPAAQQAISSVRQLMNSDAGMFTGAGSNLKVSLAKWAQAVGAPYDPRIDNTETFKGLITPILAALRPAIVGSGAQSQPEFKLLQDAAAGNITLERGSIEKILSAVEKLNAQEAIRHHKVLSVNSGGDAKTRQSMFGNFELPIERMVPQSKVELLRREVARNPANAAAEMDEFDRDWFTPGLARRLLGTGR